MELCKPKKIQMSNWGRPAPLSQRQVTYAATDAWAGAAAHAELARRRPDLFGRSLEAGGSFFTAERPLEELLARRAQRRVLRDELRELKEREAEAWAEIEEEGDRGPGRIDADLEAEFKEGKARLIAARLELRDNSPFRCTPGDVGL